MNKTKRQKTSRVCRIEELESREMLSITPLGIDFNDAYAVGENPYQDGMPYHIAVQNISNSTDAEMSPSANASVRAGLAPAPANAPDTAAPAGKISSVKQGSDKALTSVTLTWKSTDINNVKFQITNAAGMTVDTITKEASLVAGTTDRYFCTIAGLETGKTYNFTVVALNAHDEKFTGQPAAVKAKTLTPKQAAVKTIKLAKGATAGLDSLVLQWKQSTAADVAGYTVKYIASDGLMKTWNLALTDITMDSKGIAVMKEPLTGLLAGTTTNFEITAVTSTGICSTAASGSVSTAKAVLPVISAARGQKPTKSEIAVQWTDPQTLPTGYALESYSLYYREVLKTPAEWTLFPGAISGKSATVPGLPKPNTKYEFMVVATLIKSGQPDIKTGSKPKTIKTTNLPVSNNTVKLIPPTLGNVTATGSDTISVTWNAVAHASGYEVQYATNSTFTEGVETVNSMTTATTITDLDADTIYWVRVKTIGAGVYSNSDYSMVKSAMTDESGLNVTVHGQVSMWDVVLQWNVIDNAPLFSNYKISVNGENKAVTSSNLNIVGGIATYTYTAPYPSTGNAGLTTFDFVITAVDNEDNVLSSGTASAKWLASPTVTYPVQESATSIRITWADTYNHPDNVTYTLFIYEDGDLLDTVLDLTAADKTAGHVFSGLTTGKTYTFKAVAVAVGDGYISPASTYSTPTSLTLVTVALPSDMSVIQTAERAVTITWTGEAGLKYDLEIGGQTFTNVKPTTTGGTVYSQNVPLAPSAAPYNCTITAYAGNDKQTVTDAITVKTMTAPSNLNARQGSDERVNLTWSVDPNVAKYMVERSLTGTGNWNRLDDVTVGSYTDLTVDADGTTYYYRVTAYVNGAATAWHVVSNTASVTVVDEDESIKNVKVVQKPGELAAVITWDSIAHPRFYYVSIWDGSSEYDWTLYTNSLDISTDESDDDGFFVPTPGVKYEITVLAYDTAFNEFETTVYFTFEAVPDPSLTKHVIDFEFLAGAGYLGMGNSWPNNLAWNGGDAFDYPEFVWNELGLDYAEQYGSGVAQFFIDGVGFTNCMEYDDWYNYYTWYGFGLSTETNTAYLGMENEMASVTGSGANNSLGYGIAYWVSGEFDWITFETVQSLVIQLPDGAMIDSMMVTNTVWTHGSMTKGDSFTGGPLGEGKYQTLVVVGLDADGNRISELEDVEFDMGRDGNIVSDWQKLDLSSLAGASQLQFSFVSNVTSYGDPVFPVYFAFDDIVYYTA